MKNRILTVMIVVLLFLINSCCTQKHCDSADEINQIKFYNFSKSDLDTIKILSYQMNSNFTTIIDSFVTQASKTGDYFLAYTDDYLKINNDYKIILPSSGIIITLTNFEIEKDGCNGCFPYRPKSDYYYKLIAYQINGQRQTGNYIKIVK